VLASSFFFDRKSGRTSPRNFVFNLARDLGRRIPTVSQQISLALGADPDLLLSQPISHLFKTLVFDPVMASKIDGPLVVIIDALNEADAPDLDNILCSQIPNLPGMFRVFVTCRPERRVLHRLGSDIPRHDFAIHQKENRKDIAIYVDHRLDDIAANHELKNWPTSKLKAKLLKRAEGLFIWVATICDYLLDQATYPDKKLERLLETLVNMPPLPPVKKMDSLYSTILETRNWDDEDFIEGYQQVLGVMVSQKMALNVDALQELHGAMPRVKAILTPLASLITGLTGFDQPAQILHGSFCEYITARATAPRYILPGSQNARLAVLCMGILNKMFSATIGGCGYMEIEPAVGIPDVEVDHFTEEQWYAARFWPAHIVEVVNPTEEVMGALREFLSKHLTTWIEVLASKSTYQSLIPVRKWLKV
ncbi:hypothetical protein DFH09DRAFT_809033, partial [Mycena vulgaris]